MSKLLPNNYKLPSKTDSYMKLQDGENKFRVLSAPIVGWKWWIEEGETKKPYRISLNEDKPDSIPEDKIKHFWAMPVWNYQEERVQILELTQKGLQKAINQLDDDPDWGSFTEYDLVITKTGTKLDTKYQVSPKPSKPVDPGIKQLFDDMKIDLTALYRGEDPFKSNNAKKADDKESPAEGGNMTT